MCAVVAVDFADDVVVAVAVAVAVSAGEQRVFLQRAAATNKLLNGGR
jgi:hypothetical protein